MGVLPGFLNRLRGEPIGEAEYGRDVGYQRESEQIIKSIARYLNTQNGPVPKVTLDEKDILTMVFPAKLVPGLAKHKDLFFVFLQSMGGAEFGDTRPSGGEVRVIRVNQGIPFYSEDDREYILRWGRIDIIGKSAAWFLRQKGSPSYRSLQHELIHYLDSERIPVGKVPPSAQIAAAGDTAGYHQNPMEFNAFFQTGAARLRREVDKALRSKRPMTWRRDKVAWLLGFHPDRDLHKLANWWEGSYLESMLSSPGFKKKFLARWAVLWNGLKDDIRKAGVE